MGDEEEGGRGSSREGDEEGRPGDDERRRLACIMHSRRVGDLKAVRVPSVYFGLTNSGIAPPLASSAPT